MICFRCQSEMQKTVYEGVLIDYCPECKAVWLDKDEFEKAVAGQKINLVEIANQAKIECANERKRKIELVGGDICPKCQIGRMKSFIMDKVQLDKCSECEGLFFDKAELKMCYEKEHQHFLKSIWTHIRQLL